MNSVNIDFTNAIRPVKELHGVNNCPIRPNGSEACQTELKNIGTPYCRLHDTGGAWGLGHYVDIPNVFPNFDADESDPASYDFAFTDALLEGLWLSGVKPFYRLGVTIENTWKIKAYNIYPPKDFAKWARICEHIVRHYNEGWADGFEWNLEYWEIWGEPENPPLWQGTREQYFELYRISANHLKKCFPHLKIGGYGGCGFYAVDDDTCTDFFKSFITWFEDFVDFVTAPETKAPLDFFSWHLYLDKRGPERIDVHAKYVREVLDRAGLTETESLLDEWNDCTYSWGKDSLGFDLMKEMPCAVSIAAAMALMQKSSVDKAMYYDAQPTRAYCGLFYFPGSKGHFLTPTYFTFKAFNELYKLGTAVEYTYEGENIYAIAAKSESDQGFYVVNRSNNEMPFQLNVKGTSKPFIIHLLDETHRTLEPIGTWNVGEDIVLPPLSVVLFTTSGEIDTVTTPTSLKPKHAANGIEDPTERK